MKNATLLALFLLAVAPIALAQGTYTQIDYPGANNTGCWGVNTKGDIAGTYYDSGGYAHGFLIRGAWLTTVDYPGAEYTFLYAINDKGQTVGQASGNGGLFLTAFIYDIEPQSFTSIGYPGAIATLPTGINNDGAVVGFFTLADNFTEGFESVDSTYTIIMPPIEGDAAWLGITASGKSFGYVNGKMVFDFSYAQGQYHKVNIPNVSLARLVGVNATGSALVGWSGGSNQTGFLYQNKTVQTLQFPGGAGTFAYAVNNSDEVVGFFYDSRGMLHGFTWTPPAPTEKK